MHIAIRSTENQKQELLKKGFNNDAIIQWIAFDKKLTDVYADVYFDLVFDDHFSIKELIDDKPVFVHAVNITCAEIGKANYIRLNAWPGFLNRNMIELACADKIFRRKAEEILNRLGWHFAWVEDDYGFVAARIIVMIINEAYYALEENVSTKAEIDTAMKLGTNYSYGPFEWAGIIGLEHVLNLLRKLSMQNRRYTIAKMLLQEAQEYK